MDERDIEIRENKIAIREGLIIGRTIKDLPIVKDQGEYFGELVGYEEVEKWLYSALAFYSNRLKDLDEGYDAKDHSQLATAKLCEINRVEGKVVLLRNLLGKK